MSDSAEVIAPPCDLQAEAAVVGAVLMDEKRLQLPDVAKLRSADFADDAHARIWEVIRSEREQGKPLDVQIIVRRLAQQPGEPLGYPFIDKLNSAAGSGYAAEYFAEIVLDKAKLRRQWEFARKLTEQIGYGLPSDDMQGLIERHIEDERQRGQGGGHVLRSFKEMSKNIKGLKPVVIDGIAREGEVVNIVSVPKIGKSWMGGGLLLSIITGRDWLYKYPTTAGNVLLIDNELHEETVADRIPKIADAMGILRKDYEERLFVHCLRGKLVDINGLSQFLNSIAPGFFRFVLLDALYRLLPDGSEENSNSDVAKLYNRVDQYADRLKATFGCVHHSSKGSQSSKATTDVGSGAGAQSRAVDAHIVLRQHEQPGAIVLDGNVRSFPPIEPFCLRWEFPVWHLAEDLDPLALKPDRPARPAKEPDAAKVAKQEAAQTTPAQFIERYVSAEPQTKDAILDAAQRAGISATRAKQLFGIVIGNQKSGVHLWKGSDRRQKLYANVAQPVLPDLTQTTNEAA